MVWNDVRWSEPKWLVKNKDRVVQHGNMTYVKNENLEIGQQDPGIRSTVTANKMQISLGGVKGQTRRGAPVGFLV